MSTLLIIYSLEKTAALLNWTKRFAMDDKDLVIVPYYGKCFSDNTQHLSSSNDLKEKLASLSSIDELNIEIKEIRTKFIENITNLIRDLNVNLLVIQSSRNYYTLSKFDQLCEDLFKKARCRTILLDPGETRGPSLKKTVVPIRTARYKSALEFATRIYNTPETVTASLMSSENTSESYDITQQELEALLKETELPPETLEKINRAVVTPAFLSNPQAYLKSFDLLLVSSKTRRILKMFTKTPFSGTFSLDLPQNIALAIIRPAKIKKNEYLYDIRERLRSLLPETNAMDNITMFDRVYTGSSISPDFWFMMCLSVAIATTGLIKDSEGVVIGAMLVAPLMTPLIGAGLALTLSDFRLFRTSIITMTFGIILSLILSFSIAKITPSEDLTQAVIARGMPNLLDLFIALFSGMAAGYAFSRISVAEAIVGVAVAAALVPPISAVGIAIAEENYIIANGAALLFITNIFAIILGSAIMLRMLRFNKASKQAETNKWVRNVVIVFSFFLILLALPLERKLTRQVVAGQIRPNFYPLSASLGAEIKNRINQEKDVSLFIAGRAGSIENPDIRILLVAPGEVPQKVINDLAKIIKKYRGPTPQIHISILKGATPIDESNPAQNESPAITNDSTR